MCAAKRRRAIPGPDGCNGSLPSGLVSPTPEGPASLDLACARTDLTVLDQPSAGEPDYPNVPLTRRRRSPAT